MMRTNPGAAPQPEPSLREAVSTFFYNLSQQVALDTPITEAVTALSVTEMNPLLRTALTDVAAKLSAPRTPHHILGDLTGPTLAEALQEHPAVFEPAVLQAISSGETLVDVAIEHVSEMLTFEPLEAGGLSSTAPEGRRFCHTLGRLLEAGAPVVTSIRIAGDREGTEMSKVAQRMVEVIQNGGSPIRTLRSFPESFDSETVVRLETAEDEGTLGKALIVAAGS